MFADLLEGRLAPEAAPRKLLALGGLAGALKAIPAPATPVHLTAAAATATMVGHASVVVTTAAAGSSAAVSTATAVKTVAIATKVGLPAWIPTITGLTAATAAITGVTVATTQARPGDLFYGLKKGVEHAQVATAASPADAARERLAQADTRLSELKGLVRRLPSHPSTAQLDTIHSVVEDWSSLISTAVPALTTTVADAHQLSDFITDQAVRIAQLPQMLLPTADTDLISTTLRLASSAVAGVKGLLPTVTLPSVTVPTAPVPVIPGLPVAPTTPSRTGATKAIPSSPTPSVGARTTPTPSTRGGGLTLVPSNPVTGPIVVPTLPVPTAVPTAVPLLPSAVPSLVDGLLDGLLGPRSP